MTLSRLGTVVILVTLLSTTSCDRFSIRSKGAKPTQAVDLPSMIGKSREEITKILGIPPYKDGSLGPVWELPEGHLTVFKKENGETDFISYRLKESYAGLVSPEEMAKLANIDVQRRKPREIYKGTRIYEDLSVNGKTLDLYIRMSDKRYMGAWIENFN